MDTATGVEAHKNAETSWRLALRLRHYNNAPVGRRRSLCPTHYYVNVKRKGKDGGFFIHLYLIQIRMVISEGYSGSAPQVRCSHVMPHL